MKTSSLISRTFFRRPAVRELVPDLKLLLAVLTVSCESHVGVYIPGGLGEDAGLDAQALDGGLADLERRGLIIRDQATGEIFIRDFFRDNVFKGHIRVRQAITSFNLVASYGLREKVAESIGNNPGCGLDKSDFVVNQQVSAQEKGEGKGKVKGKAEERDEGEGKGGAYSALANAQNQNQALSLPPGATETTPKTSNPSLEQQQAGANSRGTWARGESGAIIQNPRDRESEALLVKAKGLDRVRAFVARVEKQGRLPWMSAVLEESNKSLHTGLDDLSKWAGEPPVSVLR